MVVCSHSVGRRQLRLAASAVTLPHITEHGFLAPLFVCCRQIYESMLFLFGVHGFDVGDLLEVEAVAYRVSVEECGRGSGLHKCSSIELAKLSFFQSVNDACHALVQPQTHDCSFLALLLQVKKIDLMYTVRGAERGCHLYHNGHVVVLQQLTSNETALCNAACAVSRGIHVHTPRQPKVLFNPAHLTAAATGAGEEHRRAMLLPQHPPHHPACRQPHEVLRKVREGRHQPRRWTRQQCSPGGPAGE